MQIEGTAMRRTPAGTQNETRQPVDGDDPVREITVLLADDQGATSATTICSPRSVPAPTDTC